MASFVDDDMVSLTRVTLNAEDEGSDSSEDWDLSDDEATQLEIEEQPQVKTVLPIEKMDELSPNSESSSPTTPIEKSPRRVKPREANSIGTIQWWSQGNKHSGYLQKKDPRGLLWKKRWFVIDETAIYYFDNKDSGKSLGKIPLQEVKGVVTEKKKYCFTIQSNSGRDYLLAAENQQACDSWVEQVKQALTPFTSFAKDFKQKAVRSQSVIGSQSEEFNLCGELKKMGEVGGWRKRYFEYNPEDHTLSYKTKKGSKTVLGNIHLDKAQSIDEAFKKKKKVTKKYIQITTQNRNFILKAQNEKMRQLWLETLKKEVEFIKKLNNGEDDDDAVDYSSELGDKIRGVLIRRTNDGSLKKRWLYFDEVTNGLYVFTSKAAEAAYVQSKQVSDPYQLEQVFSTEDITDISELTAEAAKLMNIDHSEIQFYFVIKCSNGDDGVFLCSNAQLRKSWVDHLQVQREANATESTEASKPNAKPSTLPPRKAIAEVLRIADTAQKPSTDLPKQDLEALKQGSTQALYMIVENNVTQVELSASSLNRNHVFVLDCGPHIYQWNGSGSSRLEKAKGLELTSTLKFKERGGNASGHIIEDGETKMDDEAKKYYQEFWNYLGGTANENMVKTSNHSEDDDSDSDDVDVKLYRIANTTDLRKAVTQVQIPDSGKPHKSILNSEYVYVLDSPTEIYVWAGKFAKENQRDLGLTVAEKLLKQPNRPQWLKVTEVNENAETTLWKEKFVGYMGMLPIHTGIVEKRGNIASKIEQEDIDVVSILKKDIQSTSETFIVSDKTQFTSQVLKIWRVNKFNREEYPESLHGHFFSADTFIVLFTWTEKGKKETQHVLYFWQGKDASGSSKGAAALLSVNLDDGLSGDATQVRLEQNKESDFFTLLFKNRFIIHNGSYSPTPKPTSRLYDIRGTTNWNVKAVEIDCDYSRLNSMHCFLLVTFDGKMFIWQGSQSNSFEKEAGKVLAQRINPKSSIVEIKEGSENDAFTGYFTTKGKPYIKLDKPAKRHVPRIFECSEDTGAFSIDEHRQFAQQDFEQQHCYIVIPYESQESLFVWIGKNCSDNVRKLSVTKAHEMLQALKPQGITKGFAVFAGKEPYEFYYCIHGWSTIQTTQDSRIRRSSVISNVGSNDDKKAITLAEAVKLYVSGNVTYSYQELLRDPLPHGVDRSCLEKYLSDEDFADLFDMPKAEFYKCQAWKQLEMKKKVYLH